MELSDKDLLEMHRLLVLTRRFEENACLWKRRDDILEIPHSSIGQEAIAIGACYGLRTDDWVMPSLRTRGAFFARGADLKDVLATMCAKKNGYSGGRETSHHAGIPEIGILAGSGVVGASIAVAVGAALGLKYCQSDAIVMDFFGDGASCRGDFHEGLNLAGVQQLPIVFVCENNLYAMSVPHQSQMAIDDIAVRAQGYGFPGVVVNGNDVLAVHETVQEAVTRARRGEGPTLIECKTYRWRSHCEVPALESEPWRPQAEIDEWEQKDPLRRLEKLLLDRQLLTKEKIKAINAQIQDSLDEALAYSHSSPNPLPEEGIEGIYAEQIKENVPPRLNRESGGMKEITYRQALAEAAREEMKRDGNVFLMGEDLCNLGGGFGVFQGFAQEFGTKRVLDTPISESAIAGAAVGAALVGTQPVAEIMFGDLTTIAMDHIVNSAAKIRYQHGGGFGCPAVFRTATGAGLHYGMHHSQALEAWYLHVPGLKVVVPSTPYDAKGLLKAAIRDPDPVVVFEHKMLYDLSGSVPDTDYVIPLGKGEIKREGTDVTIVAIGIMVHKALAAAEQLAEEGISVEVVDPRTLNPLDKTLILDSVRKTTRAVVTHEACKTGGVTAEIASVISEEAFWALDAPIVRVAAPDMPVPFSPIMEAYYIPGVEALANAVRGLLGRPS